MDSDDRFFSFEMKFSMELAKSCCLPKQRPSSRSILLSFIGLWVKIWHRNKTACSESNSVQSSSLCLRKGRLLRFKLNSTATSDGGAQQLGNYVWRDSDFVATKVCSQWVANEMQPVWGPGPQTGPLSRTEEGSLLRLELNSTATSDGGAQQLGNNVWRDSELILSKFAANGSQMKCDVWKPFSDQNWQDKLRFSISSWRFFELSDLVNHHLLCYWPTIHN